MARKRRLHKRYGKARRNPEPSRSRPNPPLWTELAEFVGPGFAGFAASRMITRMAMVQIAQRKPAWAKHAGAIASVGTFAAAWYGVNRVKFLEKYHTPIVVGSAIAAMQSIIQLYIPKLGWLLSDASADVAADASTAQLQANTASQLAAAKLQPINEDPGWYEYDDKYDAGRYSKESGARAPAPSAGTPQKQAEEDLLADLQLDDSGGVNMGIFSSN